MVSSELACSHLAVHQSNGRHIHKMGAENERVSNGVPRTLPQFTYLGKAATFFNLGDA